MSGSTLARTTASALIAWVWLTSATQARPVSSQDTATVRVRVAADVLAGAESAQVALSPEDEPARQRVQSVSAAAGSLSFTGLTPGAYVVTVALKDGATATATIAVGTREIVSLRAVRVPGPPSVLRLDTAERRRIGEGVDFDGRWLEDLPVGNDVWALVETTAPFVIVDRMDTGGLGLGRSGLLGGRGASWTSNAVSFGEIRVLEPNLVGLMPIAPDMTAVAAVSVTSGLARIEADPPGVVVALTPARPGIRRRVDVAASFTEPRMVDTKALPDAPPIGRMSTWREASAQMSTPVGTRSGLLISAAGARAQFFERSLPAIWTSESGALFGHLVSNFSDRDQVRIVAAAQAVKYPFEQRRQLQDRSATERGRFVSSSATWDRLFGQSHASASITFQRGSFTPQFASNVGGTVDRVWDGVVPPPVSATVTSEWEIKGLVAPRMFRLGSSRHEFRFGASGRRAGGTTEILALPTVAEQVAGIAARVWIPNAPLQDSRRTRLHGAVYAADRMTFGSSFSLDAGVRADVVSGSANGADGEINWRTVSPRGSFQWSRGSLSIFGGAGLYHDPLPLSRLGFGDPGESVSDVYRWHDLNNDRRYEATERGVLVSRAGWGPSIASLDPQLKAPRTFERTMGLELRFGRVLSFRTAIIFRDLSSLLASVNTGVPASSYQMVLVPDAYTDWDGPADDQPLAVFDRLPESFGKDAFLLTNPEGEKATYEGLEFTWNLTTRRLLALFGVTAYRTRMWSGDIGFGPLENDHGVIGRRLEQPNAQPVVQGSYFFDRSYVGKLSASYRAPGDIRLGFSARYQDGQPFSRIVVAPNLAGGAEMIHAYRIGRTRFTYTLTLDVRIAKDFSIAGRRSSVYLDVFNATRHLNEVEEDVLTTPSFRRSTAMQPPLTARLGFRFMF